MVRDLIIIGAGGFGREVLQWIKDINSVKRTWNIKGFIDDNMDALSGKKNDLDIIGTIDGWEPNENETFVCAIGNPSIKEKIVLKLKKKGATFASIVHPKASIGSFNKIGEGIVIYPGVTITVNVTIGNFVTLIRSGVGHDAIIGDFSTVSAFCDITGGVIVGEKVFMGSHVTIVPKRKIGNGAYLSAGSVVMTDVKENAKMLGNPAKKINF